MGDLETCKRTAKKKKKHNFFSQFVKIINCDLNNAIFAYMYRKG